MSADECMSRLEKAEARLALIEAFLDHEIRGRQHLPQPSSVHYSYVLPINPWYEPGRPSPIYSWPHVEAPGGV